MKRIVIYILVLLPLLWGCSKTKKLHDRLLGTWNIQSMEGSLTDSIYTFNFVQENAGTFQFRQVLATAQGGTYSFIVYDKQRGLTLMSEDETITWANDSKTVTTDNNDGKKIVWTVLVNENTRQEWSASFPLNQSGSKKAVISKMVLVKN